MNNDSNTKRMSMIVTKGSPGLGLSALHPGHHGRGHGPRCHDVLHLLWSHAAEEKARHERLRRWAIRRWRCRCSACI